MKKSLGMIEYKTVAAGITATDIMIKTAEIEVIQAGAVCPGKYISTISGDISAVNAAIEAAKNHNAADLIDAFLLGNPHECIIPAITGACEVKNPKGLGIIETFSASSAVVAADTAAKTALVDLIEIRLAKGMCGKSYVLLTGEIAALTAAVERAKDGITEGMYLDCSVIAGPDKKLWDSIL